MDITPETVDKAAGNFAVGQQDLINAYRKLSQRLQAASSMAGDDKAAHQFATVYQPAAQAAYQAFHTAIEALGGTSLGLTHTINNHLGADHHSRADKPAGPPPRYPQHQVSTAFTVAGSPPVVTGFNWAPSTTIPRLRVKVPQLPGWVASAIGDSPNWPQGNDHLLDEAGNAWQEAAQEIGKVASWLDWTISTILDPADNTEHAAVSNYWASLYKPGDSTTVLSGLSTMCQALGGACHDYAATTRKAADIVAAETIAEIIILLGAEFAGRLIGRALRPVLARVGAFMLRSVAGIAERYAIRAALADLGKAIANTKTVKVIQAAFDKTVAKKLGSALEAERQRLIKELMESGVKCTPESIVIIGRDPSGRIVFLETGNSRAGLTHIIKRHGAEFASKGIPENQVPEFLMHAIAEGTQVGMQRTRSIYEVMFNGKMYKVAVQVGSNGFIVGANMR
ncbi:hypothetical protein [Actinoallomurus sp. NPDC050550]|uniref:WXG100-like domain-containing protein n=1 Tax=Actinoallomurus sp. NPDC050550 TaxID=3154937 RepID=UPI0033CA2F98